MAQMAVPSVIAVLTEPAHASDPERSTARIDPRASVEPAPKAEKIWATASVRTTRPCGNAGGTDAAGVLVTGSMVAAVIPALFVSSVSSGVTGSVRDR